MAESKDVRAFQVTAMEQAWLVQALRFQASGIIRSRNKEMVGSEIHALRGRELDTVQSLLVKLGG